MGRVVKRPDLGSFTVGNFYRESMGEMLVEFVGIAFMSELDGETVAVFRYVDDPTSLLVATRASYSKGETFTPLAGTLAEELDNN